MKKLKPFKEVPQSEWPRSKPGRTEPTRVWRSSEFLVQEFSEKNNVIRLTINSTKHRNGIWKDGITWDEIFAVKNAVGYADALAVEVFPEIRNFINDANMRHLFILPSSVRPEFAWTRNVGAVGKVNS
ncbi:TPA: DUF7694 domain-containing protein [Vibrio parahaemolyticus]